MTNDPLNPFAAEVAHVSTGMTRDGCARHEAGHAVIAYWARLPIDECWIRPAGSDFEGVTSVRAFARDAIARIVFLFGGWAGEGTVSIQSMLESKDLASLMQWRIRLLEAGWTAARFDHVLRCACQRAQVLVAREHVAIAAAQKLLHDEPHPTGEQGRAQLADRITQRLAENWVGDRLAEREPPPEGQDRPPGYKPVEI